MKTRFQQSIGFALETNDILANSKLKLEKKNFDLIVMNSPTLDQGFSHDTNKISILSKDMFIDTFALKSKKEVAVDIANAIMDYSRAFQNLVDLSF